ncbi:MAG: hypothetical protein ACFE9S_02615 [Candidatus Hermodarchaeota archaeon]
MVFDPIERFFSSIAIFILTICSILYFSKGLKQKDRNEKILLVGFGVFWLNLAITRIFFFIIDYLLVGTYTGDLNVIILTYDVINYIFLYFYLFLYFYIFISTIVIILLFIRSSIKSDREFKVISLVIGFGLVLILVGWSLEAIFIKYLNLFIPSISPVSIIIGAFIATSPQITHFELFSKPIVKSIFLILVCLLALFVISSLFISLQLVDLLLVIIWIAIFTIISIIGYLVYFYTRRGESVIKKEELQDTIKVFTKPLKFGVEDVKYSREKGFCLVCKNKISGLSYICPNCEAWYCLKCCDALIELKNACWGCETPFIKNQTKQSEKLKIRKKQE